MPSEQKVVTCFRTKTKNLNEQNICMENSHFSYFLALTLTVRAQSLIP